MNGRALLILLLFGVWSLISWRWYSCKVKGFCNPGKTEQVAEGFSFEEGDDRPIVFEQSKEDPIKNDRTFQSFIDSLLSLDDGSSVLEITGWHFDDEENATDYTSLGEARANAVRNAFLSKIPSERIRIRSDIFGGSKEDNDKSKVEAVTFKFIPNNQEDGHEEHVLKPETPNYESRGNDFIGSVNQTIYFPYSSMDPILNTDDNINLMELSDQLNATNKRVKLKAYSKNSENDELAAQRAEAVKNMLTSLGVPESQISIDTSAKGNRLVEIIVEN